jgi:cation/acetate symporter
MATGTLATLLLIYLSPTIQVDIVGEGSAWFPLKNPALITIPLSFLAGILVSLLAPDHDAATGFTRLERQTHLGLSGE